MSLAAQGVCRLSRSSPAGPCSCRTVITPGFGNRASVRASPGVCSGSRIGGVLGPPGVAAGIVDRLDWALAPACWGRWPAFVSVGGVRLAAFRGANAVAVVGCARSCPWGEPVRGPERVWTRSEPGAANPKMIAALVCRSGLRPPARASNVRAAWVDSLAAVC